MSIRISSASQNSEGRTGMRLTSTCGGCIAEQVSRSLQWLYWTCRYHVIYAAQQWTISHRLFHQQNHMRNVTFADACCQLQTEDSVPQCGPSLTVWLLT